jgi:hypothetical protein
MPLASSLALLLMYLWWQRTLRLAPQPARAPAR